MPNEQFCLSDNKVKKKKCESCVTIPKNIKLSFGRCPRTSICQNKWILFSKCIMNKGVMVRGWIWGAAGGGERQVENKTLGGLGRFWAGKFSFARGEEKKKMEAFCREMNWYFSNVSASALRNYTLRSLMLPRRSEGTQHNTRRRRNKIQQINSPSTSRVCSY